MAKTLYGYQIGANINEKDAPKGVKVVPDNKTLIAMPFNDEADEEIKPKRLKSMKEIFAHYKPEREVVLEDLEGGTEELNLEFGSLKDFTKEGIIEKSPTLQKLVEKEKVYAKFADIFQNNERLRNVLGNEENKKELVELIDTLIAELE